MGCANCGTKDGSPNGCQNKGSCSTGSCNKMNTFDWLKSIDLPQHSQSDIIEVSFKKGARKAFFKLSNEIPAVTGDFVAVESTAGYNVGQITLTGPLVEMQMKKKRVRPNTIIPNVLRVANERDIERLNEVRQLENLLQEFQGTLLARRVGGARVHAGDDLHELSPS